MNCAKPFAKGGQAYGCGQCLPCRINRRRLWTHRILLETELYKDNCFLTLTYDNEHLPSDGSLVPKHLQLFIKHLRRTFEPNKFRFFGVGEYGEKNHRPHYHVILFGHPTCDYGRTRHRKSGFGCCDVCDRVHSVWRKGSVDLGTVEKASAEYVCGYVVKKWTKSDCPELHGKAPEFCRMSLRPGIGAQMMDEVASSLMEFRLDDMVDVPDALRVGHKEYPLGRYLKGELRKRIGRDAKAPKEALQKYASKMLPLQLAAKDDPSAPSLKWQLLKESEGRRIQIAARARRFRKKETLE